MLCGYRGCAGGWRYSTLVRLSVYVYIWTGQCNAYTMGNLNEEDFKVRKRYFIEFDCVGMSVEDNI